MNESFWDYSCLVLIILWLAVRQYFGGKAAKTEVTKSIQPSLEKYLVILNFTSITILPIYKIFGSGLDFGDMNLPQSVRWIALITCVLNTGLFIWCHKCLGKNWSMILEIRKGHKLITEGPYSKIRHPMYTHFWLLVICQGLLLDNWIVLLYGVFTWGILYFVRVGREEKMMKEEFGTDYEEYMKKTWRLLPKLG